MIPRFFSRIALHPGASVELGEEAAHHASKVLRLKAGDMVRLFDGRGGSWRARLDPAGKIVRATLLDFDEESLEPPIEICLVQALPAADKMDLIVQKAVELGVHGIQPVAAKRSVIRLSGERMTRRVEHWRNVAVAACEQCGRNRLPEVFDILDLPHYLGNVSADKERNGMRLICAPGATITLRTLAPPGSPPARRISLLVGPEGGFEAGELAAAQASGFMPLGLGPRVLRTETAGLAAIAAMMGLWGDM